VRLDIADQQDATEEGMGNVTVSVQVVLTFLPISEGLRPGATYVGVRWIRVET